MFKRDLPLNAVKEKYSDEQSMFMELDGTEVHYKDEGSGEPLILLHSINTTLHDWDGWTNVLCPHLRIIRLDLPGFGLSSYDKYFDFRLDSYIYFLKKFTTKLQLNHFAIGGVAWGADIAWHYTSLHPYIVDKLVLVNPTDYETYKPPFYQQMSQKWFGKPLYRWSGSKQIIRRRAKKWFNDPKQLTADLLERYQMMLLKEGNRKAFIALNNAFHRNRFDRLKNIQTPTLLLCSQSFGKSPFEQEIPKVQTHYYYNTKNYPMLELPSQTARDVLDFVDAVKIK